MPLYEWLLNFADVGVGLFSHSADLFKVLLERLQALLTLLEHLFNFSIHFIDDLVIESRAVCRLLIIRLGEVEEKELGPADCGCLRSLSQFTQICSWLEMSKMCLLISLWLR